MSRVLHPARHTVGHCGDDAPSQSLDRCKTDKTRHNYIQKQQKNPNNHARKLLTMQKQKQTFRNGQEMHRLSTEMFFMR